MFQESTLHLVLRLRGGAKKRKKKSYTTPKKNKHKRKKVKLAVLKYYKVRNVNVTCSYDVFPKQSKLTASPVVLSGRREREDPPSASRVPSWWVWCRRFHGLPLRQALLRQVLSHLLLQQARGQVNGCTIANKTFPPPQSLCPGLFHFHLVSCGVTKLLLLVSWWRHCFQEEDCRNLKWNWWFVQSFTAKKQMHNVKC